MTFENINFHFFKNKFIESENSKIEIINTVINGCVDFNNVFISELNLEGSNIVGILNRINLKAYPSNSDTACILKNEELKKNNTIKALKFKAIEKDLYTEELKNKKDKTPENWAEIASLKISKISNNHGQNWFKAVGFTLGVLLLFFGVFYAPNELSINTIKIYFDKSFYKELVNYFIPINYDMLKDYIFYSEAHVIVKIGGTVIYMLGKILTAYGIFEVLQAFRKLNAKV